LTTVGYGDQSSWDADGWENDAIYWFMAFYGLFGIMLVGAALGIVAAEILEEAKADSEAKASEMKTAQVRRADTTYYNSY
jgi:hypothetical protein